MSDIQEVASYGTTFDARVAIAHLESEDIEAYLATDDAGGALPSLTSVGEGARVLVRSDDVVRARAALRTLVVGDGSDERHPPRSER